MRLATVCALCDRWFQVGRWGQRGAQLPACVLGHRHPSGSPLTVPQRGVQVPGWGSEGQGLAASPWSVGSLSLLEN